MMDLVLRIGYCDLNQNKAGPDSTESNTKYEACSSPANTACTVSPKKQEKMHYLVTNYYKLKETHTQWIQDGCNMSKRFFTFRNKC
jgi:hypothetical protein